MPYAKAGDLNVYYREKGEGEPVVFVHGNWVTSLEWEPVLSRLPEGFHGIAPDLRGRGKTEGPDNDYTMPEMAADLLHFVDAVGLEKFHLVAHSLGSAVAMQFVLDHPQRVRTFTVVSPAWVDGMPAAYNNPEAQVALKSNKALFAQALKAQAPAAPDNAFWREVVEEGFEQRVEAAVRNLPALVAWKPGDRLKETAVPALVISGTLDPLTGGANAVRAAEALNAQNIVLEGVGHSPNIEIPDRFIELVMENISRAAPVRPD
jgi:pimeloyl-ACP methyl ester carboxylesterase